MYAAGTIDSARKELFWRKCPGDATLLEIVCEVKIKAN